MRSLLPILSLSALCACATGGLGSFLVGKEWTAQEVNDVAVTGSRAPTLRLDGGRASGSAGCNSFSASYKLSEERLEFGPIAATKMACEADVMEQERRFLSILQAARSYSRYGNGSVSVIAPDGRAIRFRPNR
jgi:heat shock protein HslJ